MIDIERTIAEIEKRRDEWKKQALYHQTEKEVCDKMVAEAQADLVAAIRIQRIQDHENLKYKYEGAQP